MNGVFRFCFCFRSFFCLVSSCEQAIFFMFYFLLFFSCFVTFSVLEVERAGGGGGGENERHKKDI